MPGLRNLFQTGIAGTCVMMVTAGLLLTSPPAGDGILLDRPGMPGRLVSNDVTATAFFELIGDEIELTMLFSEPDDTAGVFRSRVRLADGQRHTIVLDDEGGGGKTRFVFRRVGYVVEMRLEPASTLTATLDITG